MEQVIPKLLIPNFRNRMATQVLLATKGLILLNFAVQHRHLIITTTNHPISADLCRGGTVAAPAWPTPMQLDINNILFILMINYGDSSYLYTPFPLISKAVADLGYHIRGQNLVN